MKKSWEKAKIEMLSLENTEHRHGESGRPHKPGKPTKPNGPFDPPCLGGDGTNIPVDSLS